MLSIINKIIAKLIEPWFYSKIQEEDPDRAIKVAIDLSNYLYNDVLLSKFIGYQDFRPNDISKRLRMFVYVYENGFRQVPNSTRCMCIVAYTFQAVSANDIKLLGDIDKYIELAISDAQKLSESEGYKDGFFYCLNSLYLAYFHKLLFCEEFDKLNQLLERSIGIIEKNIGKISPRRSWVASTQPLGIMALYYLRSNSISSNNVQEVVDINKLDNNLIEEWMSIMRNSPKKDFFSEKRRVLRFALVTVKTPQDNPEIPLLVTKEYLFNICFYAFNRVTCLDLILIDRVKKWLTKTVN